jgi:hypothetical protein
MLFRIQVEDGEISPYADEKVISVETMALWDTGAETTCVCGDFIGAPIGYDGIHAEVTSVK